MKGSSHRNGLAQQARVGPSWNRVKTPRRPTWHALILILVAASSAISCSYSDPIPHQDLRNRFVAERAAIEEVAGILKELYKGNHIRGISRKTGLGQLRWRVHYEPEIGANSGRILPLDKALEAADGNTRARLRRITDLGRYLLISVSTGPDGSVVVVTHSTGAVGATGGYLLLPTGVPLESFSKANGWLSRCEELPSGDGWYIWET